MKMIFAQSQDGYIGKDNGLLFTIPEDMRYFREQTKGCTVIMGRKTWESIPEQFRPLPGRHNIILSRTGVPTWAPDVDWVHPNGDEFESLMRTASDAWVIGGSQTYDLCMPWVTEIHQTVVFENRVGDTKAPIIDPTLFTLHTSSEVKSHVGIDYQFNVYRRINHGTQA